MESDVLLLTKGSFLHSKQAKAIVQLLPGSQDKAYRYILSFATFQCFIYIHVRVQPRNLVFKVHQIDVFKVKGSKGACLWTTLAAKANHHYLTKSCGETLK